MASEYEEKWLRLRDENTELKKKKNEQEATIKRMYTKLAMIEEALKKKQHAEDSDNQNDPDGGGRSGKRDIDAEKFIRVLKSENMLLKKKTATLEEKNRQLLGKLKALQQSKAHATRPTSATAGVPGKARSPRRKLPGFAGASTDEQVESAKRQHRSLMSADLELALKERMVTAEKQLVKVQRENEALRLQLQLPSKRHGKSNQKEEHDENEDGKGNQRNGSDDDEHLTRVTRVETEHMQRELRDRQAQLVILNARYDALESQVMAEREIQEKTLEQMENMNRQVHKLRLALQDATMEKEQMGVRLAKAAEVEKEIAILREQNHRLEERMTSLCESPFIHDAFQRKERIDRLVDLEKQTQEQKTQIGLLTEENHKLQGVISKLQTTVTQIKQEKDVAQQELVKARQLLMDERNSHALASSAAATMALAASAAATAVSGAPRLTVQTEHRAKPDRKDASSSPVKTDRPMPIGAATAGGAATVTRKYDTNAVDAQFGMDDAKMNDVKHLRNRVHSYQLAHLKAMQELERCEKMLQAQTNINRELAAEIEDITSQRVSSTDTLKRKIKDLELLAEERQEKILQMEAQIRQLKYAREKLILKLNGHEDNPADSSSDDEDASDAASISESLVLAARDLSPGEQLLEIWIVNASFDRQVVGSSSSTFVLCDFYDFESQTTPLLVGNRPEYNFSSTFKVTVDGFFLRYLASEVLVFEVHQAIRGDFKIVGRSVLRLSGLLHSKGSIKEPTLPVKMFHGTPGNEMMGTLNVVMRLSMPLAEIWRVHLRSYPQDVQLLSKHKRLEDENMDDVLEDVVEHEQPHLTNELHITIFACRNLLSHEKKKSRSDSVSRVPSAYVHYQLLGYPDMFTNIVAGTSNPEFDLSLSKQSFVLEVDGCLLRFFSKFKLWLTVFDDKVDVNGSDVDDGVIGRCGLGLKDLVQGESIRGWFPLMDRNDCSAGEISVVVEWKDPFSVLQYQTRRARSTAEIRAMDLNVLQFEQLHQIMMAFSPQTDGRVSYVQFLHYGLPTEELELLMAKIRERMEFAVEAEIIQSVADAFGRSDQAHNVKTTTVASSACLSALERLGVLLSSAEVQLLEATFGVKPTGKAAPGEGLQIVLHFLMMHLNPRRSAAERLLQHKIRQTLQSHVRTIRQRDPAALHPIVVFEKYDSSRQGYVSRAEFKRCLPLLGFELVDTDKEYKEWIKQQSTEHQQPLSQPQAIAEGKTQEVEDLDEPLLQPRAISSQPTTQVSEESELQSERQTTSTPAFAASDEYKRRKQSFMDRMKAIASSSCRSLVYEEVVKKNEERRLHDEKQSIQPNALTSNLKALQDQVSRLQSNPQLRHDAATMLQRLFRQRKNQRALQSRASSMPKILNVDTYLQRAFRTYKTSELFALRDAVMSKIESEAPNAKKTKLVSRKQFGFALSQVPRMAFEPSVLQQLTEYFSVPLKNEGMMVAFTPLLHFISTTMTEERVQQVKQHPIYRVLESMCISLPYALQTFISAGDMHNSGVMAFHRFKECLLRLGFQIPTKDLRMLLVLFDLNGCDILYHAFLFAVSESPLSLHLRVAVERCDRFGLSKLRQKLTIHVESDSGSMTRQDLRQVLMQISTDSVQFESRDSSVLFELAKAHANQPGTETVRLTDLIVSLETFLKQGDKFSLEHELNKYSPEKMQRMAWNTRKLIASSYTMLLQAFQRYDWKESGIVGLQEFIATVRAHGFILFTLTQLEQIAKTFSTKVGGKFGVNYRQFLDWTTPPAPIDIEHVEAKLRSYAQTQAEQQTAGQVAAILSKWKSWFTEIDVKHQGYVGRSEFVRLCGEKLKLPLNAEEMKVILYSYDRQLENQVDYQAFIQLNWKETSQLALRKQVQFAHSAVDVADVLVTAKKRVARSKLTVDDIMEIFKLMTENDQGKLTDTSLILAMKKVGVQLTAAESRAILEAHGHSGEGRARMEYIQFIESVLGLPTSKAHDRQRRLGDDDERRLQNAFAAASKLSPVELQTAIDHLREYCVAREFKDIALNRLWKEMENNGLAQLISKKGVGLLVQKFMKAADGDDEERQVGLKPLHAFLKELGKTLPDIQVHREPTTTVDRDTAVGSVKKMISSAEAKGIDYRGVFEQFDGTYTGGITAVNFKQALVELNLASFHTSGPVEVVIGVLVRSFRLAEGKDQVQYVALLGEATRAPLTKENQAVHQLLENLRAKVRRKAGFRGRINHHDAIVHDNLNSSFAHFDRAQRGCLTRDALVRGLRDLRVEVDESTCSRLLAEIGVLKTVGVGGSISRMEFDAFVLDPTAWRLLSNIAGLLYAEGISKSAGAPPIARLNRALTETDKEGHGMVSIDIAWSCIEMATQASLNPLDRARLRHLFDVQRDGKFAYRLFVKTIAQWRSPAAGTTTTGAPPAAASKVPTNHPTIPFAQVLKALYNQLSSIEFESQVEIVKEYLRRQDTRRTNAIKVKHLAKIFESIGLSLSADAFTTLHHQFRVDNDHLNYSNFIRALEEVHDRTESKNV